MHYSSACAKRTKCCWIVFSLAVQLTILQTHNPTLEDILSILWWSSGENFSAFLGKMN